MGELMFFWVSLPKRKKKLGWKIPKGKEKFRQDRADNVACSCCRNIGVLQTTVAEVATVEAHQRQSTVFPYFYFYLY